jgi:uncharacterized protein YxjI
MAMAASQPSSPSSSGSWSAAPARPQAVAVAVPATGAPAGAAEPDRRWLQHAYVVRERRLTFGRQYRILDGHGALVAFCKQKMFRLKEDIRFYADEAQTQELFRMSARKVLDFRASVDIVDSATGQVLASVRRKGWKSLVKDEWLLFQGDAQVGTMHEEGAVASFFRRWGDLFATLIPARYTLHMGMGAAARPVAHVKERFQLWGDTYDVTTDPKAVDGRVAVGLVVLADALGVGGKGA